MVSHAISPELVLVVPHEERRRILAGLPRTPEERVAALGTPSQTVSVIAAHDAPGPEAVRTVLSRPRFAAAVGVYLIWQIVAGIPIWAVTFLGALIVTLLLGVIA